MFVPLLGFFLVSLMLLWGVGLVSWGWSVSMLGLIFSDLSFDFLFDEVSVVFLVMLGFCGSIALLYCYHYFGGSSDSFLLYPLIVWFLVVMCMLVLSGCVLLSLVLWEYLGLVSFFLILFYSKMSSLRASLITLFASRFGDVSLFFLVLSFSWWLDFSGILFISLLLLIVLSKSASYPFISWLLEAMRAPTPVSSLVHSSTLVAAGVWFFFRYSLVFSGDAFCYIFALSLVTVMISGICALFFNDLKKLVALSTCNKVSWCLMFFMCGDLSLGLLQLLTHGVCKCYLFMSIGDLMGLSGGSQSSVGVYLSRYVGMLSIYLQTLLMMSLCGLPFLGVFFSKHGLFSEVTYVFGFGFIVLLMFGFLLSYAYSVRFVLLLLKGLGGLSLGYSSSFLVMSLISIVGTLMNFYGSASLGEDLSLLSAWSILILFIQVVGCMLGSLIFIYGGSSFNVSSLFLSDSVVKGLYDFYLGLSGISMLSFYRWEVYLGGLMGGSGSGFLYSPISLFSFKVLVFSIFLVLFFFVGFL